MGVGAHYAPARKEHRAKREDLDNLPVSCIMSSKEKE